MAREDGGVVDMVVIGAGISGVVTAKCALDVGLTVVVVEATDSVGGLWQYRQGEEGGVMSFTHINVSKYNYAFSDFPFPDDAADYPSHSQMAKYVNDYVDHFGVRKHIRFNTRASDVRRAEGYTAEQPVWSVTLQPNATDSSVIQTRFVAVCSGHHALPSLPTFRGQDKFRGRIMHSAEFKDAFTNRADHQRVLVVGIGNSAVDAAVNCAAAGDSTVTLSTRSGAWVAPNYIFGYPTDLYACRGFLWLPWKVGSAVFETVLSVVQGPMERWGLNPTMRALQSQPTVSATLIYHIQRGNVEVVGDVAEFLGGAHGKTVRFKSGEQREVDVVIACTGYKIALPFLSRPLRSIVLDEENNSISLYKNVFSPEIGSSVAFIGFVQPASGGILMMAETQARWWCEIIRGKASLPRAPAMLRDIEAETAAVQMRYTGSKRHTIQRDPILYCDEVAGFIGAKPSPWSPRVWARFGVAMAWRLLVGSGGAAQYRLLGPNQWKRAAAEVRKVPMTPMLHWTALLLLAMLVSPAAYKAVKLLLAYIF